MNQTDAIRLEYLLTAWETGVLSAAETAELARLLRDPEARVELVENWRLNEAIYDTFRARPVDAPVPKAAPAPVREVRRRLAPPRRLPRWLVWHEVQFSLGWSLGVALSLLLLAAVVRFYFQTTAVGQLTTVTGAVTVEHANAKTTARAGQSVYPGDLVRVPAAAAATLAWASESTQLRLAQDTVLHLWNPWRGKRCSLLAGALEAVVASQPFFRPLVVSTPEAAAKVVGTHFSLFATGAVTRIEVLEGAVQLRATRRPTAQTRNVVTVRAGETATAGANVPLAVTYLTGFLATDFWSAPADTPLSAVSMVGKPLAPDAIATGIPEVISRLRGFLVAPATGDFTFWIASLAGEAPIELWLSPDDQAAHKQRIAYWSPPSSDRPAPGRATQRLAQPANLATALDRDFQRSPTQQSVVLPLVQGRRYYLEIWRQGSDVSSFSMRWRLPGQPDGAKPSQVDWNALCPFLEK